MDYCEELEAVKRFSIIDQVVFKEDKNGQYVLFSDVEEIVKSSVRSEEFTTEWYGARFKRLREWVFSSGLSDEKITEYFNIVANGTKDSREHPTYEQQFNVLKWKLERAQMRIKELEDKQ